MYQSLKMTNIIEFNNIKNIIQFRIIKMEFTVFNTISIMLRDRGYNINGDDELDEKKYKKKYKKFPDYLSYQKDETEDYIFVFNTDDINKNYMKYVIDILEKSDVNDTIIVGDKWSKDAEKEIYNIRHRKNIQFFKPFELTFPIIYHDYQPKFRKLNENEIEELKTKFFISDITKIPKLSVLDPISRYFNYIEGDVIEIERNEVEKYKYYRYVQNIMNPRVVKK